MDPPRCLDCLEPCQSVTARVRIFGDVWITRVPGFYCAKCEVGGLTIAGGRKLMRGIGSVVAERDLIGESPEPLVEFMDVDGLLHVVDIDGVEALTGGSRQDRRKGSPELRGGPAPRTGAQGLNKRREAVANSASGLRRISPRSDAKSGAPPCLQLKVTLLDVRPPIWRRIVVPGNLPLDGLNHAIQVAMGWQNSHLHQFILGDRRKKPRYIGMANSDDGNGPPTEDERKFTVLDVLPATQSSMLYEYDFGDSWEHEVVLERIRPAYAGAGRVFCLGGARACPPEDCGGVSGYENLLEAIKDPKHEEHDDLLQWVGGSFDPEAFDMDAVNVVLSGRKKWARPKR